MNRLEDARAANEQVRRLLETLPQGALESADGPSGDASSVMSKAYFEQWLKWSSSVAASTG
jgi:hypothetical protein